MPLYPLVPLALLAALLSTGCGASRPTGHTAHHTPSNDSALSPTALALSLLRAFPGEGSRCVSPVSLSMALQIAVEGAEGETKAQLDAFLAHPKNRGNILLTMPTDIANVLLANALWSDEKLIPTESYLERVAVNLDATAKVLPLRREPQKSAELINGWVEENTKGLIKNLVNAAALARAELVITSALYFSARWAEPFDPKATNPEGRFRTTKGEKLMPLMHQSRTFSYAENATMQAVELPYTVPDYRMLIILPKGEKPNPKLLLQLSEEELLALYQGLERSEVRLTLPKFDEKTFVELSVPLRKMGLTEPFCPDADFSGISPQAKGLPISSILQSVRFKVDEEKTEAAAATALIFTRSFPADQMTFRADRPFLYMVYRHTPDNALFMGIFNPIE